VIDADGKQIGVLQLGEAITLARTQGVDLVEVAPNAVPPVCRIVDFGKYQYEQSKKEKESKKHQHSNRVKEIQLRPVIDPHDFSVKLGHAVDFLCDDMKVKLTLRFRGREMRHQEIGIDIVQRFIKAAAPFGTAIEQPKVVGRGMSVMINPLPRNKRAPNPRATAEPAGGPGGAEDAEDTGTPSRSIPSVDEDSEADGPAGEPTDKFDAPEGTETR
jgi:translation initiation factor IF-3